MYDDNILPLLVGGGIGYLIANNQNVNWKSFNETSEKRFSQLKNTKVPLPSTFLKLHTSYKELYREAVRCYVFGLPNSGLSCIVRILELALKEKYEQKEKKKAPKLDDLINWAESYLKTKKEIAHSFRLMRNKIHSSELVEEQDLLEAIRHISIILGSIYPLQESIERSLSCPSCKMETKTHVMKKDYFVGYTPKTEFRCLKCNQPLRFVLMP